MLELDVFTFRLIAIALMLIAVFSSFIFWRSKSGHNGTGFWTAGVVSFGLVFVISYLPFTIPVLSGVLIDMCVFMCPLFFLHGTRKALKLKPLLRLELSLAVMGFVMFLLLNLIQTELYIKMAINAAATCVIIAFIALDLSRAAKSRNYALKFSAYAFGSYAVYSAYQLGFLLLAENINVSHLSLLFLGCSLFIVTITLSLIVSAYSMLGTETQLFRNELRNKIRNVENQWDLALEFSRAGAWEFNIENELFHYSNQWKKLLGYKVDAFEQISASEIENIIHPDDLASTKAAVAAFIEGKAEKFEHTQRVRTVDGNWIWLLSRGKFASDSESKTVIGIDIDITEQKKIEEELQQAIDKANKATSDAEMANRAKSTFLANMSHEIRTPMNAILGFSQLLRDDPDITPEQMESLQIINKSGEHLLSLIDDILDWSRIESGNTRIQSTPVDLQEVLHNLVATFSNQKARPEVEFLQDISPDLPGSIISDQLRLTQICTNLLSNAFKFTRHGNVTLKAWAEPINKDKCTIFISVIDTGVGISQEEANIVFNVFGQTQSGLQATQGSGLGLFISKNIAKLMDGDLYFESAPGKGSTFTFMTRVGILDQNVNQEPIVDELPGKSGMTLPDKEKVKLLIVDDIKSNRQLLKRMLEDCYLEIYEAGTALEGIRLIEKLRPDLVLMDIRLPGLNGDKAISEIRKIPEHANLPIIAVTANVMEGEKERLMEIGANDFVSKPFSRDQVISTISKHLQVSVRDHQESMPVSSQSQPQNTFSSAENLLKILVVDDNKANQQLLQNQLEVLGYKSDMANNGEEGLDMWTMNKYDLVFADCAMPLMDGFEMSIRIRQQENQDGNRTVIIAITGSAEEYRSRCLEAGMDDVLGKPLLIGELKNSLQKHIMPKSLITV